MMRIRISRRKEVRSFHPEVRNRTDRLSVNPMMSPPRIAPLKLPRPPKITTINALIIGTLPIQGFTEKIGAKAVPARAAKEALILNVIL
jgi:hypothetical protein